MIWCGWPLRIKYFYSVFNVNKQFDTPTGSLPNSCVSGQRTSPKKLQERDAGIARRIREVRESLRLTRNEIATQLGIKLERLASYEDARVPIPFDIALDLCRQFLVSEKWLATGLTHLIAGGDNPKIAFGDKGTRHCLWLKFQPESHDIQRDTTFSVAYASKLGVVFDRLALHYPFYPPIQFTRNSPPKMVANAAHFSIDSCAATLSDELKVEYLSGVIRVALAFHWELSRRGLNKELPVAKAILEAWGQCEVESRLAAASEKIALTKNSDFRKSFADMKSVLKQLLDKVRTFTEPAGMKSKLAADLGVPQARVSEWLSGKHDPSGETTLQLLRWVELQERKAK